MKRIGIRSHPDLTLNPPRIILGTPSAQTKPDWSILAQICFAALPATFLLGRGNTIASGKLFFISLFVLLLLHVIRTDRQGFASVAIALCPLISLLRSFFFYNSPIVILGTGVVLWFITSPQEFLQRLNNSRLKWLLPLAGFYWILSFLFIGEYFSNLRAIELAFSATLVYLLAGNRRLLATSFIGISITVFLMGLAFLKHGVDSRLGSTSIEEMTLGNPIAFGIPLALIIVLSISDNGKWMLLENKNICYRLFLSTISGTFLLLSASRGSLLVATVSIVALMMFNRKQRRILFIMLSIMLFTTLLLLKSQRGEFLTKWYDKTFSSERTLNQRTSGRFEQWLLFSRVFMDSPLWGFGPGSGRLTYSYYAYTVAEEGWELGKKHIVWHSLYLHVGAETGAIGLAALAFILLPPLGQGFTRARHYGEMTPFLCVLGFMSIGLSVPALDMNSGVYLGLGLLTAGRNSSKTKVIKIKKVRQQDFHQSMHRG